MTDPRRVSWFSCGAASATATKLALAQGPLEIVYCETGSEHADNKRFMGDCEKWFGQAILRIKSTKWRDTWDIWTTKRYISGIHGAECTGALKIRPRLAFQRPDDIHHFGYTNDKADISRADALKEHWPELAVRFPLIDNGINKAACLDLLIRAGVNPPITYALGLPNANCIPCCKATSPRYWALIRKEFPKEFERMAKLLRDVGARLTRIAGERIYIDEIPMDHPVTDPIMPECDLLCGLAEEKFGA